MSSCIVWCERIGFAHPLQSFKITNWKPAQSKLYNKLITNNNNTCLCVTSCDIHNNSSLFLCMYNIFELLMSGLGRTDPLTHPTQKTRCIIYKP